MSTTAVYQDKSTIAYLCLIIVFCVLCWNRFLDDLTLQYLDQTLLGSGAIYATARSINALISVLQGTEISAVFVSVSVGEVLDPVNDLIERFSGLMLLALGSLALQRLLISIVSHDYVSMALVGLSLVAAVLWFRPSVVSRSVLLKFVLFLVATRVALPIITLSVQSIESVFLEESESMQYAQIQGFQRKLEDTNKNLGMSASLDKQRQRTQVELDAVERTIESEAKKSASLERELEKAKLAAEQLERPPTWKPWETPSAEVIAADQRIDVLEKEARQQRILVRKLKGEAEEIEQTMECVNLRSQGKECSVFDTIVKKADPRPQLQEVSQGVNDFVKNLINLLISLLFRSVLLPIVTLWVFVKITIRGMDILLAPSTQGNQQ